MYNHTQIVLMLCINSIFLYMYSESAPLLSRALSLVDCCFK